MTTDHALNEYSLWLVDRGDTGQELKQVILKLSESAGSKKYLPHLTLLSGLAGSKEEMIDKMQILAKLFHQFSVKLAGIKQSDNFYKAIYAYCEEDNLLIDLNQKAQSLFAMSKVYKPHISLLYADKTIAEKEDLIEIAKASSLFNSILNFETIELWSAIGEVDQWKQVATVPFQKHQ